MPTNHEQMLSLIAAYKADPTMSFDEKSIAIFDFVTGIPADTLGALLGEAGFIPEEYPHDSSEEKVYAKAMDILVAVALTRIGYHTEVSVERANSADVTAECSTGESHTLVLDAKAFRLSRTALNPKDYKIEALNTWRKGADYACLVGPLAGFPQQNSRVFNEAVKFKVTLLTFSHLQFALEHGLPTPSALSSLWKSSAHVLTADTRELNATQYWLAIDRAFCQSLKVDIREWKAARRRYFNAMLIVADKQVEYFEREKVYVRSLPQDALVELALKTLKLDDKIRVIRAKKRNTTALLSAMESNES